MSFRELDNRIHPKSHIGELRGLLPEKYSPLRANGDGLQSVYLAEVGRPFAAALFRLIGGDANKVADVAKEVVTDMSPSREPDLERWEERVENDIREDPKIPDTQREAIIQARVGKTISRCGRPTPSNSMGSNRCRFFDNAANFAPGGSESARTSSMPNEQGSSWASNAIRKSKCTERASAFD